MPPLNHQNCKCTDQEREIAPLAIARALFCFGGPWDGERRLLEADESEIPLAGEGIYLAMASKSGELLRWRSAA